MAGQTVETLVGAAVVAVAVGFGLYAARVGEMGGRGASYPLVASFRSAEGIGVGTDVRLAGVKVGAVTGLALDPATFRAEATISVDDAVKLPDDTAISVASEGLLGGSFLEVLPGGSEFSFAPGDRIQDTESAVSIVSLLLKFVSGGGQ